MAKHYRADQVGSFLRPPELKAAHTAFMEGKIPLEEIRQLEDRAILDILELQRQSGIEVLSDGEFRRSGWGSDFRESVDGYVSGVLPIQLTQHRISDGSVVEGGPPAQGGQIIGEKLVRRRRLTEHESSFLKQHAGGQPYKMTMPAPSYVVARGYAPAVTDRVYENRAAVLRDASTIIRQEIEALIAEGVPYIQLDNPHYTDYISDDMVRQMRAAGIDPEQALREDIEADNATIAGLGGGNVTIAMHLCRGNGQLGNWHVAGGYEAIDEQVFGNLNVARWLLEYDSERAGGFEPLRFMPKGKQVVLGLVTTKSGTLESQAQLRERIQDAAKYVDLDDLALSPQCGFSSTLVGNPLTPDEQRRKLDLVVSTAREVWGSS
jgi:5-methyltetrahydropteroyltriglutamate--homocysteine methyltransferase